MNMANDLEILGKAMEAGVDIAKDVTKETGKTSRENKKSEEETKQQIHKEENATAKENKKQEEGTKQKKIEEREQTEREKTTANKETRKEELDNNIKIFDRVKSAFGKTTNILNDNFKEVKNDYKEIIDKKETELVASREEIKAYQKSLMSAYGEVQRYRVVEEVRNIVANNIINYAEKQAKYNEEIKNITYTINEKEKELQPLEMELNSIKTTIVSLQDAYDELGKRFEVVVKFMSELKFEHKGDLDPQKYSEKYGRKKRELIDLIDDISNKELQLLEKERERLNKIEEINPLMIDLKKTKKVKDILENSKEKFLSVGILEIGNLQLENMNIDTSNTEDIIDVDMSESPESSESEKLLKRETI